MARNKKYRTALAATYELDFIETFNGYLKVNIQGSRSYVDTGVIFPKKRYD